VEVGVQRCVVIVRSVIVAANLHEHFGGEQADPQVIRTKALLK
jgi:hypothetical protein